MVKGQILYNIYDSQISKVRKRLTIERFQNETLKRIQSKQSYEDALKYNTGLIRFLIQEGISVGGQSRDYDGSGCLAYLYVDESL